MHDISEQSLSEQLAFTGQHWFADRTHRFDSSGIRRMFQLAAQLKNPINLSIGQPDFPVPEPIRDAICQAVQGNRNGYTPTEGIGPLREKLQAQVALELGDDPNRDLIVVSGTSGGLTLAIMSFVNPGDEVIYFDPYFVMYPAIVELAGGVSVPVDIYPDFRLDLERLAAAITPRTKMILLNSPANPTGVCFSEDEVRSVAELAARHNLCLVSDEIYSRFLYDSSHATPARYNPHTLVIDGLSKTFAMTGLRVGYCYGPKAMIEVMAKLQQFTFVCAPAPAQWGALVGLDLTMAKQVADYRQKRDAFVAGLSDLYRIAPAGGAFYLFPQLPEGMTSEQFLAAALERELLVIPGSIFSRRATHFRISYAVDDSTIQRGIAALRDIAQLGR